MGNVINYSEALEAKRSNVEMNRERRSIQLGKLAIEACHLGIDDPITDLSECIKNGAESIRDNVITNIAERLPQTYFANSINFDFTGNDFVSQDDKFSMLLMNQNCLRSMKSELHGKPEHQIQIDRAEAEMREVETLINWFSSAAIGENLVFESLPIGETQEFAVTRIYQKINQNKLKGNFLSLYNSDIEQFNSLRQQFKVDTSSRNQIEMLQNYYQINTTNLPNPDDIIDYYVNTYDQLLGDKNNKKYNYGIEKNQNDKLQNSIEIVKSAPGQVNIYLDVLESIKSSNGIVTPKLMYINEKFKTKNKLTLGQNLTVPLIREQLKEAIFSIASTFDNANLSELVATSHDSSSSYDTASYFNKVARASGKTYDSIGCPEFTGNSNTNNSSDSLSEGEIFSMSFMSIGRPKNFGKEKIGICRIDNCPSRGKFEWWPDRTLVGGCSVCLHCHKIFQKGKNPKDMYSQKSKKTKATKAA